MYVCSALYQKPANTSKTLLFMPAKLPSTDHILYSFRRCPYAMRARMA
jgi:hypothetical protein